MYRAGLTEWDPEAAIISIDRVGAFDLISRRPVGRPPTCERRSCSVCQVVLPQSEGGEQGCAMTPLLFAQHGALQDASRTLEHGEHLMAFLGDTYYVSKPARVGPICGSLGNALWRFGHPHPRWQNANLEPSGHPPDLRCSGEVRKWSTQQPQCGEGRCVANRQGIKEFIPIPLPGTSSP